MQHLACRLQSLSHLSTNQCFIYICLSFNILWSNHLCRLSAHIPSMLYLVWRSRRREGHAVSPHDLLLVQRDIDKLQRAFHAHVSLHKAHICISLWNSMPCVKPFGGVYQQNVVYSIAKFHHLTKTNKGNLQKITSKTDSSKLMKTYQNDVQAQISQWLSFFCLIYLLFLGPYVLKYAFKVLNSWWPIRMDQKWINENKAYDSKQQN